MPSSRTIRFSGLMSRCTIPAAWAAARARATCPISRDQHVHSRAVIDQCCQGPSFDQFHDEEGPARALAAVVDRADVRVIQGRGGAGLAPEAREPRWVRAQSSGRNLRATRRSRLSCRAAYTTPMPPRPSGPKTWYPGPARRVSGHRKAGRRGRFSLEPPTTVTVASLSASSWPYSGKHRKYSPAARPGSLLCRSSNSAAIRSIAVARGRPRARGTG